MMELEPDENWESMSSWDVATRYHEFKSKPSAKRDQKLRDHLRQVSVEAILLRARGVLGSLVHPTRDRVVQARELTPGHEVTDLAIEETFEASLVSLQQDQALDPSDLWFETREREQHPVVLCMDTSLSMTGEKLALTAVALAVVALEFPDAPMGMIAFENEARILKKMDEKVPVTELIERFLDVPAQGYTHLENGILEAWKMQEVGASLGLGRGISTLLVSDGKYTAGRDPSYLGGRFHQLLVLKMGREKSSLPLCRELVRRGQGSLRTVAELEELPEQMYGAIKDILRGRSLDV
jgi:Mg-chelatase subunit ChlD